MLMMRRAIPAAASSSLTPYVSQLHVSPGGHRERRWLFLIVSQAKNRGQPGGNEAERDGAPGANPGGRSLVGSRRATTVSAIS